MTMMAREQPSRGQASAFQSKSLAHGQVTDCVRPTRRNSEIGTGVRFLFQRGVSLHRSASVICAPHLWLSATRRPGLGFFPSRCPPSKADGTARRPAFLLHRCSNECTQTSPRAVPRTALLIRFEGQHHLERQACTAIRRHSLVEDVGVDVLEISHVEHASLIGKLHDLCSKLMRKRNRTSPTTSRDDLTRKQKEPTENKQ